jgi:hypothetical protein
VLRDDEDAGDRERLNLIVVLRCVGADDDSVACIDDANRALVGPAEQPPTRGRRDALTSAVEHADPRVAEGGMHTDDRTVGDLLR